MLDLALLLDELLFDGTPRCFSFLPRMVVVMISLCPPIQLLKTTNWGETRTSGCRD
jgi:hypothetical protein